MDPNETLRQLLALVREIESDPTATVRESDLAERVDALNTWLASGGFLPKAWEAKR